MRVAVVDWDVAYPLNSGKRLRTTNLMLSLADRHEITYVSRGSDRTPQGRTSREFLADHGIKTHYFDSPVPAKTGLKYPLRIARNLFSKNPYAVDVHCANNFAGQYRQYAAQNKFDLWQFEWTPYCTMLDGLGLKRLAVAHNVDSLIWKRYAETETRLAHRLYIREQYGRFERFEKSAFEAADRVVSVSKPDADLMRQMFAIEHVDVVDNGVDVAKYSAVERQPNADELLFLGSLDWRPNQDAVSQLLEDIFPRVLAKRPSAKLSIVGRRAPASMVQAIDQSPGVTLHADVPDVLPFLSRAALMTIPLRIGGGSRLKMIESLAASVPVVASAVAAEGLDLRPGQDYTLVNDSQSMVEQIVRLLNDADLAARTAESGARRVASLYGWDRLGKQLETSWQRCVAATP